jgi:hypothetical protein
MKYGIEIPYFSYTYIVLWDISRMIYAVFWDACVISAR